ncbi:unnamed protein product [Diamesa serratosioi]
MNNLKLITFLLIAVAVTATLSAPSRPFPYKKSHPVLVKYRDEDGNIRMTMVKQPQSNQQELSSWGSDSNVSVDSSEEASIDESADLHKYAERDGPNEDYDDLNEKYNISEEDDLENAEVYNESDDGNVYGHPYNPNINSSDSSEEEAEEEEEDEAPVAPKKNCKQHKLHKPKPCSKKRVYVYKQPPIIVNPKPTNVYIRSKPIVVRPPPLVVHHADPKPCNPIIKYQPPNIKIRPVIVKISKPKTTTTTTTTPCPTTTRKPKPCTTTKKPKPCTTTKKPKPCKKHKKPSKKCGRCQKNRTVYYNQHDFVAPDHQYVKQYKNLPCHDDIYT